MLRRQFLRLIGAVMGSQFLPSFPFPIVEDVPPIVKRLREMYKHIQTQAGCPTTAQWTIIVPRDVYEELERLEYDELPCWFRLG